MASSYTDIGTELMATGENAGTWGTKTNTNIQILEEAINGYVSQALTSGGTVTLSYTDGSLGDVARHAVIALTGALSGNAVVEVPANEKVWIIDNQSTNAYTVTVRVNGQTGVTWGTSDKGTKILYANGTDVVDTNIGGGVGGHDLNGEELILDADADTSITADTDDQIDIKIAGADDFQFTANTFTAQSGSTIAAQALTATTITASGIVKTDDTTEATSTTDGSLQTDGGLSVAKDAVFGDDVKLLSDSAVLSFGADSDITVTHAADTGLTTNGTFQATTITATTAVVPDASDGAALGTTSLEWSDLYIADGGIIYFGDDQEITLTHAADDGLILKHVGTGDGKEPSLTFQAGDNDIAANDVLGSIFFQAPDEGAGTDAILVAAGIEAVSEGDFSSSNNATKLSFKTAASEAASEKMSLSSAGLLTVADDIVFKDGGTIGVSSATDAMTVSSAGIVTFKDDILIKDGGTIGAASDADSITIAANGVVTFSQAPVFPDGSIAVDDLDIDGATDIGAAIVDADLFIVDDGAGGTNRKVTASRIKTYVGAGALDDITTGDSAVTLSTSSGNITIDATANDTDIIFKGTDNSSDITMLTLDGSDAGSATFNHDIILGNDSFVRFGDAGEKITGDGTDLTVNSSNDLHLTASTDINVPANVGMTFGDDGEKIEGDGTDLTIASSAKLNLTATSDVHIPNNVGIIFGGDSEKIEGDGTDLTISANNLTIDCAADLILDAGGNDFNFKAGGTEVLRITNSSSDVIIKPIVDTKDIIFQQRDGTEVARVEDNATFNFVTDKLAINGTAVTSTAAELNKLDGAGVLKQAGKETIWIPANAMTPTESNGCASVTSVETTSGRPDMLVLDFDKDSDEFAQFSVAFPKSWNAGTITYQFFWSGIAATTTVTMTLAGVSFADNDSIDTAYGTAVAVEDTAQGAVEEMLVSSESGNVTIAGSPGDNELVYFRIGRDVSEDNMAGDCRLHGVKLFFTTDLANDA
jgi:hypothetical protein